MNQQDIDLKGELYPDLKLVKKRTTAAIIMPEHMKRFIRVEDLIKFKMGPGN
jgi:hypothetical protein